MEYYKVFNKTNYYYTISVCQRDNTDYIVFNSSISQFFCDDPKTLDSALDFVENLINPYKDLLALCNVEIYLEVHEIYNNKWVSLYDFDLENTSLIKDIKDSFQKISTELQTTRILK
jgi:hypothetical protein